MLGRKRKLNAKRVVRTIHEKELFLGHEQLLRAADVTDSDAMYAVNDPSACSLC